MALPQRASKEDRQITQGAHVQLRQTSLASKAPSNSSKPMNLGLNSSYFIVKNNRKNGFTTPTIVLMMSQGIVGRASFFQVKFKV